MKIIIIIIFTTLVSCGSFIKPENDLIIEGKSIGLIELGQKYHSNLTTSEFNFILNNDSLYTELSTNSSNYITTKGIKVGDSVSLVYKKYGENPKKLNINKGKVTIGQLDNVLIFSNIKFFIENNKVKTISIF